MMWRAVACIAVVPALAQSPAGDSGVTFLSTTQIDSAALLIVKVRAGARAGTDPPRD